eukprot:843284-Rhodomonas_salina.1
MSCCPSFPDHQSRDADGCCWCGMAGEKSTMGRGGMSSKIAAARVAALGGVQTVIASGYDLNNITNQHSSLSQTLFLSERLLSSECRVLREDGGVEERRVLAGSGWMLCVEKDEVDVGGLRGGIVASEKGRVQTIVGGDGARCVLRNGIVGHGTGD